jgi:Trypsin
MTDSMPLGPGVGRILTGDERITRMAGETAFSIPDEILRSAFVISTRHVLTAYHCVRDTPDRSLLWLRLRSDGAHSRTYIYVPLRLSNYDETFDVAALAIDEPRLGEVGLSPARATALLGQNAVPLEISVRDQDHVQVVGFPESATGADSDTISATVETARLPLGDATGLKLFGQALAAISPVEPHGLSGAPVLLESQVGDFRTQVAVGVVRAVPRSSIPGIASGGCIIATRMADVIDRLPEAAVAWQATQKKAPPSLRTTKGRKNVLIVSDTCRRRLRESIVEVDDSQLGPLVGWPHFFNEPQAHRRPTAIGTAYGLKLALVLGAQDFGPSRSQLAETLWKLRRADGGWAARTGTEVSRPEVSALVLGALSLSGFDAALLAGAQTEFERSLAAGLDSVAIERTNIVSAVMRGLIRSSPSSSQLAPLRSLLLAGAIQDPRHGGLLCWSDRLQTENEVLPPSVAHTAQAVVALIRARHVLGEDAQSKTAVDQSVRWLRADGGLDNQTEQIRRFVAENKPWETLTIRHFTAAWVARALLLAPAASQPAGDSLLDEAMRRVWQSFHEGLWQWENGERPVWMSYQGASVARDFAMHTSLTPP